MDSTSVTLRCETLGRAFEMSADLGYDSREFVDRFMRSDTAYHYGLEWDFTQAQSAPYFVESVEWETGESVPTDGQTISADVLYWMGWQYCYCNMRTGIPYLDLYQAVGFDAMVTSYMRWHTMSPEAAMEEMLERVRANEARRPQRA